MRRAGFCGAAGSSMISRNEPLVNSSSLETAALSAADVEALSKLPSKDAMRGMLLGTLLAPATSLVRVLNAPLLNVLYALKAYEEKKNETAA